MNTFLRQDDQVDQTTVRIWIKVEIGDKKFCAEGRGHGVGEALEDVRMRLEELMKVVV